jgi:hypothetical protein
MNIVCSQPEASISQGETDISQSLIVEDYQTQEQQPVPKTETFEFTEVFVWGSDRFGQLGIDAQHKR